MEIHEMAVGYIRVVNDQINNLEAQVNTLQDQIRQLTGHKEECMAEVENFMNNNRESLAMEEQPIKNTEPMAETKEPLTTITEKPKLKTFDNVPVYNS